MSNSGGPRPSLAGSDRRRVAVIGGHGGREFVESLADRCGGILSADILVSGRVADEWFGVERVCSQLRTIVVPELESVSRGDLIARYDAVVYAFTSFRDRPLSVPGAGLEGSVWADDITDVPERLPDWSRAIVVGSGERASAAVRAVARTAGRRGGQEIVLLGGCLPGQRAVVDGLPTRLQGVAIDVRGQGRLLQIRGRGRVEAVVSGERDGSSQVRSVQLVVNATGELPAVMAGLPTHSSGLIAHEGGCISGTAHEFVLGPLESRGATSEEDALAGGILAGRVARRLDDCRGAWSHVDPFEWLEFRHGAVLAAGRSRPSVMVS
ncbi:hypothetical protein [Rhodococcus opacus]|uniref:Pyridine nucleotide-disulfide oxidoreductase n=1 Tax=Rhodococcus opacus (strain B4) TaxID=632772 RepID=C1AVH8_RHOOB|nr:hypothetical protein [Rhodococcus opacus]BAH53668.1 hypothetical protein ROP_54210 [Rhodococcus opacus B4]